jgi:hypothetical protein
MRLQSLSYILQFFNEFSIFFWLFSQNLSLLFIAIQSQSLIFKYPKIFIFFKFSILKCVPKQIEVKPWLFFSFLKIFLPMFNTLNRVRQHIWYKLHHPQHLSFVFWLFKFLHLYFLVILPNYFQYLKVHESCAIDTSLNWCFFFWHWWHLSKRTSGTNNSLHLYHRFIDIHKLYLELSINKW